MKSYNKIAGFNRQRIEALSDGVFAIALTLLILDIKVPNGEAVNTELGVFKILIGLAPKMVIYFVSFVSLGVYWSAHATQFHYISKSDRNLGWISLFLLLFVSIVPFSTAFLSHFITSKVAIGVYWLNIMALGITLALNWWYAYKKDFLSLKGEDKMQVTKTIKTRFIEAHTLYTIGALLCFINNYVSIFVLVLIQLNYAISIVQWLINFKKVNPS